MFKYILLKKILIIRFSSIGDIVLTTPLIRCLKKQLNVEIHFLTKQSYATILRENPYLDYVHTVEKEIENDPAFVDEVTIKVEFSLPYHFRYRAPHMSERY